MPTPPVLETFVDHRDAEHHNASLAATDAAPTGASDARSCDDLHGRTAVCVSGRGPLDAAVAAMIAQLLGRAGCTVRALSRDAIRRDGGVSLAKEHADAICILGLFDERSFRRLQPIVQQVGNAKVLIGVRRTHDVASSTAGADGLLPTLAAFCEALQSVNSSEHDRTALLRA